MCNVRGTASETGRRGAAASPSRAEVIESLAFLERNRCVELYKWCDVTVGFRAYRDDPSDQTSFFRGEFWIVPIGVGRRLMLECEQ